MNSISGLRFLRPCRHRDVSTASRAAYIRFFYSTRPVKDAEGSSADRAYFPEELVVPFQVQERVRALKIAGALEWPRVNRKAHGTTVTLERFHNDCAAMMKAGTKKMNVTRTLYGRVRNVRKSGAKLVFIDIEQDRFYAQITLNFKDLESFSSSGSKDFHAIVRRLRRGDIISCTGSPYITRTSGSALGAIEVPKILSPCLDALPTDIKDREKRARHRHLEFLVDSSASNVIKARSKIIQHFRSFLLEDGFLEVQTPILADKAGGAMAKPFTTHATEFPEKSLALRVAPELWLKRLIIGGMDRIFEIGPAFRNEGLDATHNPEFTTCEFYKAFAELEELISMTEKMFAGLAEVVTDLAKGRYVTLPIVEEGLYTGPYQRISFIPAVEEGLQERLPDLQAPDAQENLVAIFKSHGIPLPASPTLPRLLDKLASIYIEPQCIRPTFITYHPACMAPLAKSFLDRDTKQYVSARAELFIQESEVANMYEEENSPFEQRKKFLEQVKWKDEENAAHIDESYLEAMEWGMPPTGGWGMGLDRVVMLFTDRRRISDVMAFGNLRNVVGLGVLDSDKVKTAPLKGMEKEGGEVKEEKIEVVEAEIEGAVTSESARTGESKEGV